jgi:hypothetical protein
MHRNTILHKTTNIHDTSTLAHIDMEIQHMFPRARQLLPIGKDCYLVRSNVQSLYLYYGGHFLTKRPQTFYR